MPLRTDKKGWYLIQKVGKKGLGLFLDKVWPDMEERINQRVENDDWRRETTEEIRQALHRSLGGYHPDVREEMEKDQEANAADKLAVLIDVFTYVYDADDAYALMFHNFLEEVREGNVPGKPDNCHVKTRERKDWREKENMKGDDADYSMDEFDEEYQEVHEFYDFTEEILEDVNL